MQLTQFIDELDFNRYEKEVIVFLVSVNNAGADVIYKNTRIPKGRIYSVLNSLIEKGIVKLIPTSPKKYLIENVKESLENYLKSKKNSLNKQIQIIEKIELQPKLFSLEKNAPSVYTFTGRE